jgi:hypothetical protein
MLRLICKHYYQLKNRPYGTISTCAFIMALVFLCALASGLIFEPLWPYSIAAGLGFAVLLLPLLVAMMANLRGKLNDIQDAISLEHGLRRVGYELTDFFTDEAAGSPSLQLLHFKILRLCQPQQILELGSGQTTKLLSCYQRQNPSACVLTLEQDETWAKQIGGPVVHDYRHVPLEPKQFTCAGTGLQLTTIWFKDLPELHERKFDYLLVDGPDHGGPGTVEYSRCGFLQYMPGLLAQRFIIVFDDAERYGETMTIDALDAILRVGGIKFVRFARYGIKTQVVFCSTDLTFLRSV